MEIEKIGLCFAYHAASIPPKHLSCCTCGIVPTKGNNPVVTRNRRISNQYVT